MKHLKKFNEAKECNEQDILDSFMDIIDNGFIVNITYLGPCKIDIIIGKSFNGIIPARFNYSEVKETLLFAIPYLLNKHFGNIRPNLRSYKLIRKMYYPKEHEIDLGKIDEIDDNLSLLKLNIELKV